MATHNYWHMAITYLEEGNTEAPLELYDKYVCDETTENLRINIELTLHRVSSQRET